MKFTSQLTIVSEDQNSPDQYLDPNKHLREWRSNDEYVEAISGKRES